MQRVSRASVKVDGACISEIGDGLLILICAMSGDGDDVPARMAQKISKLRIFRDDQGRMHRSILDINGSAMVVSTLPLAADTSRGNRPGFSTAAPPELGERLYESFASAIQDIGISMQKGQFGADMSVELINDGPVTIWIDI